MSFSIRSVASAVLAAATLAAGPALAQHHAAHRPQVSLEQAQHTALTRVPGTVRHEELEYEDHRWIYSFEISAGRPGVEEVNVDADTGAVVSVEHERG